MSVDFQTLPTSSWWDNSNDGPRLLASHCVQCGSMEFPPSAYCYKCGACPDDVTLTPLSREGELYSYSVMHVAPSEFSTPYAVGYVDHPEGIRVLAQIHVPTERLTVGCRLVVAIDTISSTPDGPLESYCYVLPAAHEADGDSQ